jgi:argininosuccinate lyase
VKDQINRIGQSLKKLERALLKIAEKHIDVVMPGYTHLQRAQPIYLAHYLLGQIEAFSRDADRLRDCMKRTDVLPLGSGALAGSTIVLDRELIARALGFTRVSQNSVDAVGDRDFICEFLFCLAMISLHLSRLSEDLILWSTSEFGFVEFSDEFSTGSSLMPQKKNPDMAELTRGKTGRVYGNLMSILTILKGLPSSYNRDLQEDKGALFDSANTVLDALETFSVMLAGVKIDRKRMNSAAKDPDLLATDLAEHLVKQGMPFRHAHEIVGKLVAFAKKEGIPLDQVSRANLRKISARLDLDLAKILNVKRSLAARTAIGAPAAKNVRAQIERWRKELQ